MKLVTNDYGCGTSSSILDYGIQDVVIVSEKNYEHVFEVEDDLFFIGHDFLFYLWDNEEKLKKWMLRAQKHEHWLWCFERIDAIVPAWQQKSHFSLSIASKFCKRILACDEDDCDKYGTEWLPQWASKKFFDKRKTPWSDERFLFSGQAGKPEYHNRNVLLQKMQTDEQLKDLLKIQNIQRNLSWEEYVDNLLGHKVILNPVGILKALNTRAYEAIYSNRLLLQQTLGNYKRHQELLKEEKNIIFFYDIDDLKSKLNNFEYSEEDSTTSYTKNSLYARMLSVGLNIK
jgi:hypothetical protein